jgi:hypothetical protein
LYAFNWQDPDLVVEPMSTNGSSQSTKSSGSSSSSSAPSNDQPRPRNTGLTLCSSYLIDYNIVTWIPLSAYVIKVEFNFLLLFCHFASSIWLSSCTKLFLLQGQLLEPLGHQLLQVKIQALFAGIDKPYNFLSMLG